MVWKPNPSDAVTLDGILTPIGSTAVRVVAETVETKGLLLLVSGRSLLALPDAWGDVQLEARVDLSEFDGSLALGARVSGDSIGGFIRMRSDGNTQLVSQRTDEEEILDEAYSSLSGGVNTLGLSAIGRHWKGFVDGATVVHGHGKPSASGRAVLLLDGTGVIRLFSVRISPVNAGKGDEKAGAKPSHEH